MSLSILAASADAGANSSGFLGATRRTPSLGCAGCHGAAADPTLLVAISGPAALDNGQAGVYTVRATRASTADGTRMGINVAADDPESLTAIPMTATLVQGDPEAELTHSNASLPLNTTAANIAWYEFIYTMPGGAGTGTSHTLYATAALGFLGWNHAANFTVRTRPFAPVSLAVSGITTASLDLSWAGTAPEYRVVYKPGAIAPANVTDGTALDVGASAMATIGGLAASTQYTFAVYAKLAGVTVYSSTAATVTAATASAFATERYVSSAGANGGNCGDPAAPCKTITYAMQQAFAGDRITVFPGAYNSGLGEVFPIIVKSGVRLIATGTQAATIIDATGANARVFHLIDVNASTLIEGFTITGGLHRGAEGVDARGGAVLIRGAPGPTLRRNFLVGNEARGYSATAGAFPHGSAAYGGAIASVASNPTLENNVFASNFARGGNGLARSDGSMGGDGGRAVGGAVSITGGAGIFVNNTLVANGARGGAGGDSNAAGGHGAYGLAGGAELAGVTVINNIVANNVTAGGAAGIGAPMGSAGPTFPGGLYAHSGPVPTNNLFFGNTFAPPGEPLGANAILTDPQFLSSSDYRVGFTSPAKGAGAAAGAPSVDFEGVPRPAPPSIGAFEATRFPSTTTVLSSTNPSVAGNVLTFTATVASSGGTPTGSVTFRANMATICAAVALNGSGQAQCASASLPPDTYAITADYSGSNAFAPGSSVPLTQLVQPDFTLIPRLGNISTRGEVLTDSEVMIGGFVIGGSANKKVLVRARGPSLGFFGIVNALQNPQLQLIRSWDQSAIASNDNWGTAANAGAIAASGFAPSHSLESAILVDLAPGAYTAILSGVGGTTGVAIIEVFELDHPEIPLANISTRGRVGTANNVLIGGFVIQGSAPQTVVVRARGPSLVPFGIQGALMNPHLQLVRSSDQTTVAANDDWGSAANAVAITASGFAPSNPREAALLVTLPPGAYTAIVTGIGGDMGVAIVEVFAQ